MTLYKRPLNPFDPVVKEGQDGGSPRYYRDDFSGSGQDSYTNPPGQDPTMWQALLNIMPISRKSLDRRWGYGLFSDLSGVLPIGSIPTHIYEYQRDTDGLRKLVITTTSTTEGLGNSFAIGEDGGIYASNITYSQSGESMSDAPRALVSRSTMYFYGADSQGVSIPGSNVKWDGSAAFNGPVTPISPGVSNWGIDVNNVAGSASGPDYAGTATTTANLVFNRPTAFATVGGDLPFANPANAMDGNPSTSSTATSTTSTAHGEIWSGFASNVGTSASTIILKVSFATTFTAATGTVASFYSLNGGSTFSSITSLSVTNPTTTFPISLSGSQDLTQVQVKFVCTYTSGTSVTATVVDIWIESETTWANPAHAEGAPDGSYATTVFTNPAVSDNLVITNYGMSATGDVLGIQVGMTAHITASGTNITTFRPSAFGKHPASYQPYFNGANATDGNPATESGAFADRESDGPKDPPILFGEQWLGFSAYSGPTPTSVTLFVTSQAGVDSGITSGGITLSYSLDNGSTSTTQYNIGPGGDRPLATDSIPLTIGQDLTKVFVFSTCVANHGLGTAIAEVVDIWIEVVTGGTVSTAATASIQLIKGGAPVGAPESVSISSGADTLFTLGSSTDLWGTTWLDTDVTDATFGLQITVTNSLSGATTTVSVDSASITVYLKGAGVVITSTAGAGSLSLVIGRIYYLAFSNSKTGHISDISFPSVTTGPLTNKEAALSFPVSLDPQVDTTLILATADGGDPSTLYLLVSLPAATTTYTDQTNDTVLTLNQIYQQTDQFGNSLGISDNTPPPLGNLAIKHQGRLWMALGQSLFFSKSTSDLTLPNGFTAGRYEEAWPGFNFFDISPGAETVTGLLSDGSTLYIGTQRHVRRLFGSDPTNFQEPEVLLQGVGVVNQDVWCPIFMEGTPAGAMWLTPDNKIILSDFNTYKDVGTPVQDILNTINPDAVSMAHATYASNGPYDVYILAIPTGTNTTCDTHLIFDIRTQMWMFWVPTDPSTAIHFNINANGNPQWLFANPQFIYEYSPLFAQDRVGQTPVSYISVAQTSWMDMGFPTFRKLLNEIEVTGDPTLTITLQGANTQSDFTNNNVLLQGASVAPTTAGTYKLFLATIASAYKRYRFSFSSTGPQQNFLDGYNIYVIPLNAN